MKHLAILSLLLFVYDVQGRLFRVMLDASPFAAGSYQKNWNERENRVGKLTILK